MDYLKLLHNNELFKFLSYLSTQNRQFFLDLDINKIYLEFKTTKEGKLLRDDISEVVDWMQEVLIAPSKVFVAIRVDIANWHYIACHIDSVSIKEIDKKEYLFAKERVISEPDEWLFELNLENFYKDRIKVSDHKEIGRGSTNLCANLSLNILKSSLFEFLTLHKYQDRQLMINARIKHLDEFDKALDSGVEFLNSVDENTLYSDITYRLQDFGFEAGWGDSAKVIKSKFLKVKEFLKNPTGELLEEILSQIPMVFNVVILSPHGYFSQENVFGFPDTGGQVVYILDQVRALEKALKSSLKSSGVEIEPKILVVTRLIPESKGTSCNQEVEDIWGCENSQIVRVPFRDENLNVISYWISRFNIWSYLEQFSVDVEELILAKLQRRPDLIIGNYSDGNLVASLLAKKFDVTQATIAHALEKVKYLYSALFWRDNEEEYHFSAQFSADLIAMNRADFVISSTYQEIAGTKSVIGQYESYQTFCMPELIRVTKGIDVLDSKFNILSPGANEEIFFSYKNREARLYSLHSEIEKLLYWEGLEGTRGNLVDSKKPIIFTIARLDKIKNLTGFVEMYAKSKELREVANVVLVAGQVNTDALIGEERVQAEIMHNLFSDYGLDGSVRWIGKNLEKPLTGEFYRYIADKKGVFIQPALFEAFGLTVIESMSSGLPTFATCYGGPLEIIEDDISGYHIDPTSHSESAKKLVEFFKNGNWQKISDGSIARVESAYNWELYANRLISISKVYGFYRHIDKNKKLLDEYIDIFYSLFHRPIAKRVRV